MQTLNKYFLNVTISSIIVIPLTALIAGISIFYSNVIFGSDLVFIQIWKYMYIVGWTVSITFSTMTMLGRICLIKYVSMKVNASFSVVEKEYYTTAPLRRGWMKRVPLEDLTPEVFKEVVSWNGDLSKVPHILRYK